MLRGRRLGPDDRVLAAMTSYRAGGGARYLLPGSDRPVLRTSVATREALQAVLCAETPLLPAPWRFETGGAEIETWIDTGPGAEDYLHEVAAYRPGTPEMRPSGFLRIPLTL